MKLRGQLGNYEKRKVNALQPGEVTKVKISRFKREYAFECGNNGMVLERIGGGICCYATSADHEDIYCAMPLGMERDFKDSKYYVYAPDERYMLLRVGKAVLLVDFEAKVCATNVKDFRMYGSPAWGQQCQVPWKDAYTAIYTAAEKRRVAELTGGKADD